MNAVRFCEIAEKEGERKGRGKPKNIIASVLLLLW